jgi:hypothetical protein
MILLTNTNQKLELTTSSTADIDFTVHYADVTTTTFAPDSNQGKINSATTTDLCVAPAASTQRLVKEISIRNTHASASNVISVKKDVAATEYKVTAEITLLAGEAYIYSDGGWKYYGADGQEKFTLTCPNNSIYRTIMDCSGSHVAARIAGTYGFGQGDPLAISGTGTLYPLNVFYIDSTDWPTVNGLAAKLRVKAQLFVNDVAPTGNFTFGLHPVTRPSTSGGAALNIYTIGAAVAGSTAAINTPAVDSMNQANSADFAIPANGYYVLGVVTTATVAASSHLHLSAFLQMRNN